MGTFKAIIENRLSSDDSVFHGYKSIQNFKMPFFEKSVLRKILLP